jgi:ribosomal protein S18 acetylase RimI-like enzyme
MKLVEVTQAEYDSWYERCFREYKAENIRANGLTDAEAETKARGDFDRYLPNGLGSPDQYIFTMKEKDETVGFIWFCERGPSDNRKAYILDIVVEENQRGKGYGKEAMLLLEEKVKALELKHIGLHVFGHNHRAHELYKKLGYIETNIVMEKTL